MPRTNTSPNLPMSSSSSSTLSALENFTTFYEDWLASHEAFLDQLLRTQTQGGHHDKLLPLIKQVLSHYQRYYEQQYRAAGEDVFEVFSAPWLSSYERTLIWVSGFKPSIVLRLLDSAVDDLTAVQEERVEAVRAETKRREKETAEAMARVQERVAAPPILGMVRRAGRLLDGEICEMDEVMEELRRAMVGVLERADMVRGATIKKVMEILSPEQMVKLLAAAAEFQLRIRRWGVDRDSQRTRPEV